ncbi:MAG: hypothetical protein Q9160_002802 [Pyrenula sp. 1 TL-2023]
MHQVTTETIISFLMEAPKIVRDLQPMHWTFLDAPSDGTLMLVWQPLEQMQTTAASDGYVYADMEHAFYQRDSIPAASIPISQGTQIIQNQRKALQSLGQLPRKEFMLHDKSNYPTINLPPGLNAQNFPHPNFFARQQQIGQPGMPTPGGVVPPPNRGVPPRPGHASRPSITNVEPSIEEEEDVSRGDLLDFMTPREISKVRYEQHHEWMEEIVASPFATKQIIPADLGLGRMGELEALTRGFFESPSGPKGPTTTTDEPSNARVGKMDVGKAEEFTRLASQKVSDIALELDALKKQHSRRMAKLQKSGFLTSAEKRLRNAALQKAEENETQDHREAVDDIVGEVETAWGKQIGAIPNVTCVEKGGLEEPISNGPAKDLNGLDDSKLDFADDLALDQNNDVQMAQADDASDVEQRLPSKEASRQTSPTQQPVQQQPSTSEPPQTEQPTSTTAPEEPKPAEQAQQEEIIPDIPSIDDMNMDIEMASLDEDTTTADQPTISAGDDWVMVSEEPSKPASPSQPILDDSQPKQQPSIPPPPSEPQQNSNLPEQQQQQPPQPPAPASLAPASDALTTTPQPPPPAPTSVDPAPVNEPEQAEITPSAALPNDFDLSANFDSAGDALDAYGAENEGTGDLDLEDMGMGDLDDSAFGEVFQPEAS